MTYRKLALAVALGGLVVNVGCGGSSSSPSPTPAAAAAPVTTTVAQAAGAINPLTASPVADFSLASAGTVTATFRWTFATTDIDIWVLNGTTCNTSNLLGVPAGAGCTILCSDTRTAAGTSATCSFAATAGTFRLWATNYTAQNESGTYTITVTR
jgi:hypothetical protein